MPGFVSAQAVEAMTYDFTAHDGPQGVIPEPSQEQVEAFFERIENVSKLIRDLESEAKKIDDDDDEALDAFLENLPRDKIKQVQNEMAVWIADLCSDHPDTETVRALPYRVFMAFVAWLSQEVGPKDKTATSN